MGKECDGARKGTEGGSRLTRICGIERRGYVAGKSWGDFAFYVGRGKNVVSPENMFSVVLRLFLELLLQG
jgi:hypothetical protein